MASFSINRTSKKNGTSELESLRISDCGDVNVINPQINDVLTWNGTNWIAINNTKFFKIGNCVDVNSSKPSINDILKWDGKQWKPSSLKEELESKTYQELLQKNKTLETRIKSLENIIATLGQFFLNK